MTRPFPLLLLGSLACLLAGAWVVVRGITSWDGIE